MASLVLNLEGNNELLSNLCGPLDENIRQISDAFSVKINRHGGRFTIEGDHAGYARYLIEKFYEKSALPLTVEDVQLGLVEFQSALEGVDAAPAPENMHQQVQDVQDQIQAWRSQSAQLKTRKTDLRPRTPNQALYLKNIQTHDINFGIGPAGTGKTWLAVACAVDALERDVVQRIVLTRPAVEAGERLGFLPGDLSQKVDPYLRPLYDALYDLMGVEKVQRLFDRQLIEIAPLAYMRGRTLNHAFVILDEAQNTTSEQMKMFLTRIGFGSKAVITGDATQIDLPRGQTSGLIQAMSVLEKVQGLSFTHFNSSDVVRHPLVAKIIDAYEVANKNSKSRR
ncbi:MAG: PhoH family protein [Alcaligenaceae bacterium]|nr:PhoH family protein [Alcaligenaceae bacterium]